MKKLFTDNRKKVLLHILVIYIFITIISTILYPYVPIIFKFSVFSQDSFYSSIITNFYSGIIDFIIFTLIIWIFNQKYDEEDKINKYQNDIDDCRFWMSEEAMHKIWGNIRRLSEKGITSYDLSKCMLEKIKLKQFDFLESKFMGANLNESNLEGTTFRDTNLQGCSVTKANLNTVKMINCNCKYLKADYVKAKSYTADKCDFIKADFSESNLSYAILKNCDFKDAKFNNACLKRANLKNARNLTIDQILQCKDIEYIILEEVFYQNEEIRIKSKKIPTESKTQ